MQFLYIHTFFNVFLIFPSLFFSLSLSIFLYSFPTFNFSFSFFLHISHSLIFPLPTLLFSLFLLYVFLLFFFANSLLCIFPWVLFFLSPLEYAVSPSFLFLEREREAVNHSQEKQSVTLDATPEGLVSFSVLCLCLCGLCRYFIVVQVVFIFFFSVVCSSV